MPYLCLIRSDIPDTIVQVLDLKPNSSQRSYIYDPPGQTKYVNRVENDTVVTVGAGPITTQAEYKGLAAYLIDRIEDTPNGDALTATQANTIASALVTRLDSGLAMTQTDVNSVIAATVTGSGIGVGNSTGTLDDLLLILAGGKYTLPAGTQVETGGNVFDTTVSGSFTATSFRHTYDTGALRISFLAGELAEFVSSTFAYQGLAGAALLVLNDDGSLYS